MIRSLSNKGADNFFDLSPLTARQDRIEGRLAFIEYETMRARRAALLSMELQGLEAALFNNPGARILIAGWYGADNLGDELMLRAVIEHLPAETLARTAVLLWDNSTYDRLSLDARVHAIHYPATTRELDAIVDHFDIVIWGGGAIIDDKQFNNDANNFNTGNLFIRINELMIGRGKSVYCLGLSANENISNQVYLRRLKHIIEQSRHFSLRDKRSKALLVSLGMPADNIALCEDLVFSMPSVRKLKAKQTTTPNDYTLGFVLFHTDMLLDVHEHLIREAVTTLKAVMPKTKLKVLLIPFLNEGEFDHRMNLELKNRLEQNSGSDLSIELANYELNPQLSPICSCDSVICYKYHAALIACCAGIPCLMVSRSEHPHYANKMGHLAELAGVPEAAVSSIEFESNVSEHVKKLLATTQRPVISQPVYADMDAYMTKICSEIAQ